LFFSFCAFSVSPSSFANVFCSTPSKSQVLNSSSSAGLLELDDLDQDVEKTSSGLLNYLVPNIEFLCEHLYSRVFIQTMNRIWLLMMGAFKDNVQQMRSAAPLDFIQVGYLGRVLEVRIFPSSLVFLCPVFN